MTSAEHEADTDPLLRKAINLFTFLGRTQQLLVRPVRYVSGFDKVMWFGELPDHDAVWSAHRVAALEVDTPLLTVDRVGKLDPPAVPTQLTEWVEGKVDDVTAEPTIRAEIYLEDVSDPGDEEDTDRHRILLENEPEIAEAFESWLADWRLWAERERRDAVARNVYKELFAIQLASTDHSEEFELVLGVGCLTWRPDGHEQVLRHVATAPIAVTLVENTGRLTVTQVPSPETVSIELEMLDPAIIPNPTKIEDIRELARGYEGHLLDQPEIGAICRRLIHRLDADGVYDEDDVAAPSGPQPRGTYAPAIILRKRTNRGMVQIYEQIVAQIQKTGDIPLGVLPLIDPDRQPVAVRESALGAVVTVDGEDFLPLPVNEAQRRIIDRVDSTAQTVVQGPPGTGKTHTAAALVSHLLAQGKRVLITAHTDRALKEVRAKLPREIQSLAVAVIGQSRSDMADLRTAVDNISRRADEFDTADSKRSIARHTEKVEQLRRQRAEMQKRLLVIRRQEVEQRTDGPAQGTLAAIAYQHLQDESNYEWIRQFEVDPDGAGSSVSTADIQTWHRLLLDEDVAANEAEATLSLPAIDLLTAPHDLATQVVSERETGARKDAFGELLDHDSFAFVHSLNPQLRNELRERVSRLAESADALERREELWMNEALRDVRSGRQQSWLARSAQVKGLAGAASQLVQRIGLTTRITVRCRARYSSANR